MEVVDFIFRQVNLPGAAEPGDVAVLDGRFLQTSGHCTAAAREEVDCRGKLLLPPFVDAHFHLDSVFSLPETGENLSGTLWEGIDLWRRYKQLLSADKIFARADSYCQLAVKQGLLFIRSHVDTSYSGLAGVEALVAVREKWKGTVDIQLVAFPQDGYLRQPTAAGLLKEALELGVDVVGGIPHYEESPAAGAESVRLLCRLAAERGLPVDMHCDETDDPGSRHVQQLALCAREFGLAGRVAASHTTSLHSVEDDFFEELLPKLLEAEVSIIANPLINITLQGRGDHYPKRRGITRIPELLAAGVNVAAGLDCVCDPWYALGDGDMLDAARMVFHACQMTAMVDRQVLLDLVTTRPARALGLQDYGLAPGNSADAVLLDCADATSALRLKPSRLLVMRAGKILHQQSP